MIGYKKDLEWGCSFKGKCDHSLPETRVFESTACCGQQGRAVLARQSLSKAEGSSLTGFGELRSAAKGQLSEGLGMIDLLEPRSME